MKDSSLAKLFDREAGFSITELLVTVVIIGIVGAYAMPELNGFQESNYKSQTITNLEADIRRLRAEAIASGGRGILNLYTDRYEYGIDLPAYSSCGTACALDTQLSSRYFDNGISMTIDSASAAMIIIDSRGYHVDGSNGLKQSTIALSYDGEGSPFDTSTLLSIGFVCRDACSESF